MIIRRIQDINVIIPLHEKVFGQSFPMCSYYKKIQTNKVYIFVYEENLELFGYSIVIGEESKKNLYAWYGGVLPEFQGSGITQTFFENLTEFAKSKGYESITLASSNLRPHMLRLAIKMGFDIYDLKKRDTGEGNKIYFKYDILPQTDEVIYLQNLGYVEIETNLVKAFKNNCTSLTIICNTEDWNKLIYAVRYCSSFSKKPQIIIDSKVNTKFDDIIETYQGKIIIKEK